MKQDYLDLVLKMEDAQQLSKNCPEFLSEQSYYEEINPAELTKKIIIGQVKISQLIDKFQLAYWKFCGSEKLATFQALTAWLLSAHTGSSSITLAKFLIGYTPHPISWPLDGADFGRCVRLLKEVPHNQARFDELPLMGIEWGTLHYHWETLKHCYYERDPGTTHPEQPTPNTDRMISELLESIQGHGSQ
ncbi:MAG: hypothetical protein AAGG02_12235 [Cyanobacteria bacterium P01_H01_bin.15]